VNWRVAAITPRSFDTRIETLVNQELNDPPGRAGWVSVMVTVNCRELVHVRPPWRGQPCSCGGRKHVRMSPFYSYIRAKWSASRRDWCDINADAVTRWDNSTGSIRHRNNNGIIPAELNSL